LSYFGAFGVGSAVTEDKHH